MRIKQESELLSAVTRAAIIQEIKATENLRRKHESYKRYQCYKDNTKRYVVENMLAQFDDTTVKEMRYSISNISIVKKVIDKLARVYSNGVSREVFSDKRTTESIKVLEKELDFNSSMKTANRFLKLQKNMPVYVMPCPVNENGTTKWTIKPQSLLPHLYDAVEDYYDRTKPLCFILSDYKPLSNPLTVFDATGSSTTIQLNGGNGIDEKIADKAIDQGAGELEYFIFWSKNYHFTCLANGEIVKDEANPDNVNPFGVMPIVNFAIDQDGSFWAEGGSDLIDGAVLLNSMITHTNHVGVTQGYGQAFMTGENLPTQVKIGPTKLIRGEYKKDDQAPPTFEFVSANPQLDSLRGLTEAYVALLLTTNNLSTSGISAQLSGTNNSASGIALIIDKAESLEDVQDQRQIFLDKEPVLWDVIRRILDSYQDSLVDGIKGLYFAPEFEKNLSIKFFDPQPIMSEKEKLENMKLREELGLESMISLLMKDDNSLTEEMAEEKLMKILEQQILLKIKENELKAKFNINEVEVINGKEDSKKSDQENKNNEEIVNENTEDDGQ